MATTKIRFGSQARGRKGRLEDFGATASLPAAWCRNATRGQGGKEGDKKEADGNEKTEDGKREGSGDREGKERGEAGDKEEGAGVQGKQKNEEAKHMVSLTEMGTQSRLRR